MEFSIVKKCEYDNLFALNSRFIKNEVFHEDSFVYSLCALITLVPSCFDWDDNKSSQGGGTSTPVPADGNQQDQRDQQVDELEGVVGPRLKTLFQEIKAEPQETPDGEEVLEDYQISRLIIDPYAARAFYHTPSDAYIYRDIFKKAEKSLGVPCGVSSGTMFSVYANRDVNNIRKESQHRALDLLREKLEGPDSTVLRVELGCHSFVIHKEDNTCHVIQSWIEGYDIDNNLDETFTGNELFRKINMMITTGIRMGSRGYSGFY